MGVWVTADEATTITGVTVTSAQVAAAHPIIEIFTNITTAASGSLKPNDLRMVRYAEAYQARWMPTRPDFGSEVDVDHLSQDGISFTKDGPDSLILAPLAKRCIHRLSWMRGRTLLPLTPHQAFRLRGFLTPETALSGAEEFLDDYHAWTPMRGAQDGGGW